MNDRLIELSKIRENLSSEKEYQVSSAFLYKDELIEPGKRLRKKTRLSGRPSLTKKMLRKNSSEDEHQDEPQEICQSQVGNTNLSKEENVCICPSSILTSESKHESTFVVRFRTILLECRQKIQIF